MNTTYRSVTLWGLITVALSSCAVNPATGERQLILISENREIQMGREADIAITAQLGLYDDPELAAYVEEIGFRLQAVAERPNLPWTFRLVDDPIVNAFALPGGFIYITRGILAHLNNEAQLAAVIGHEIGHVTGRHGAEQLSRARFAQIGLGLGSLVSPTAAQISGVAGAGLGLLFLRYGRDDERQADALGFRYMDRSNYDPREMPHVFTLLGRVTAAAGGRGTPSWLSTHPDPGDRHDRIARAIAETGRSFEGRDVGGDSYLDLITGMTFGPNPRDGFFEGNLFMHPDMEFQLAFPRGWVATNQPQVVRAVNPDENTIIQLTISRGASPISAAFDFLSQSELGGTPERVRINGMEAAQADFSATNEDGSILLGRAVFIRYGESIYQVMAYGTSTGWARNRRAVQRAMASFDRLRNREALEVQPLRLAIVTTSRTATLGEFYASNPAPVPVETIALINQLEIGDVLRSGTRIKTVVRGSP